jgi:hypothetical protein
LIDVHDLRAWGRASRRDFTAVHRGRLDHPI